MISRPVLPAESVSVPAFARRVALSVLALEIDELLHRSGRDAFAPPASIPGDSDRRHPAPSHPQTHHSS